MPEPRPRILIVDDREQTRYVMRRVLAQANYECEEVSSAMEALRAARRLPDIMILDVHLPDLSGFDVCHQVKKDPFTAQISVLQVSASFIGAEDKVRALEAGADGYLVHPIDGIVLVATVRSLLRLRAAEATARQSAEEWQAAFEGLAEGLALFDENDRLVRWNAALAKICGPVCAGQPLEPGLPTAAFLERLTGSAELPGQFRRYSAEVTLGRRTAQLSLSRIGNGSGGAVLVLADITDRKLAEYAVRTAEKVAATGKLAHSIAHEINNPLEAVTNLLYLARSSRSVDEIHSLLATASGEVERIARITRQTLAFHRETDFPAALDLSELVRHAVELFRRTAAARRVRIAYDPRPVPTVYGFSGQISQVIGNLLRNATEAAPPDSEVTVRTRPTCSAGCEGVAITIHDRGHGIPDDVKIRLFDPFFTTRELKGSGLGLWVSRNLVMRHGGVIRFRSCIQPGRSGTSFRIVLPVHGVKAPSASQLVPVAE